VRIRQGPAFRAPIALGRCARHAALALLLLAAGFAFSNWTLEGLPWSTWLVWVAALFGVSWGLRALALAELGPGVFTALVIALVTVPRLAWVVAVPTLPVYDYLRYHTSAIALLHGARTGAPIQDLGIVGFLAALAAGFGPGLLAGKLADVLLAVPAALLLLALGRRLFGEPAARAAALLFALWPADIAFRSVFATEFGFVLGWLGACVVLLRTAGTRRNGLPGFGVAGALIGLGTLFRPVGALLVPVALVWVAARTAGARSRAVVRGAALVVGFAAVLAAQLAVGGALGFDLRASSLALNIVTGTDTATQGQHSDGAAALVARWTERDGPGAALVAAVRLGWRRVVSRPGSFIVLALAKYGVMWGNDANGVYWSTERVGEGPVGDWVTEHRQDLFTVAQLYYLGLLVLAIIGAWRLARRRFLRDVALLLMTLPAFAIVHVVLEVQGRYHYPLAHVLLLLAGAAVASSRRRPAGSPAAHA
jgi:4-amino-4-deoxy-L-arabinose transferase-like glycosyltransferase